MARINFGEASAAAPDERQILRGHVTRYIAALALPKVRAGLSLWHYTLIASCGPYIVRVYVCISGGVEKEREKDPVSWAFPDCLFNFLEEPLSRWASIMI